MLRCNNCGETSPVETQKCPSCHMIGELTPHVEGKDEREPEREVPQIACNNCGQYTSEEESECRHCAFPLPGQPLGNPANKQLPLVKSIRKIA